MLDDDDGNVYIFCPAAVYVAPISSCPGLLSLQYSLSQVSISILAFSFQHTRRQNSCRCLCTCAANHRLFPGRHFPLTKHAASNLTSSIIHPNIPFLVAVIVVSFCLCQLWTHPAPLGAPVICIVLQSGPFSHRRSRSGDASHAAGIFLVMYLSCCGVLSKNPQVRSCVSS